MLYKAVRTHLNETPDTYTHHTNGYNLLVAIVDGHTHVFSLMLFVFFLFHVHVLMCRQNNAQDNRNCLTVLFVFELVFVVDTQ